MKEFLGWIVVFVLGVVRAVGSSCEESVFRPIFRFDWKMCEAFGERQSLLKCV